MKLFRFVLAGAFAGYTIDQHGSNEKNAENRLRAYYAKRGQKIRIRSVKELRK